MAEGARHEVLMKFEMSAGGPIPADCQSDVRNDSMIDDFRAGYFFELEGFGFGLRLDGMDESGKPDPQSGSTTSAYGANHMRGLTRPRRAPSQTGRGSIGASRFSKWSRGQENGIVYPCVMEPPVQVTRIMDRTSPILFENCCNSVSLKSASIVKRKATPAAGMQTYLRVNFDEVLIVGMEWTDGETIKETCRFICRKMSIVYKQQRSDAGLGERPWEGQAIWEQAPTAQRQLTVRA